MLDGQAEEQEEMRRTAIRLAARIAVAETDFSFEWNCDVGATRA